jgi:hypothetical protein
VRVFEHRAVPREMLDRRGHAGQAHAAQVSQPERRDDGRIGNSSPQ